MEHRVNKGVGRSVEFSGLQAQYLYTLAEGLLFVFLVFVILYMAEVNRWFCILFGAASAPVLVLTVLYLGRKYGPHGLMKLAAARYRPFHIINHKRIISLLERGSREKRPENGSTGR